MFSPHGKQKLLLQIKLAEDQGVKDPLGRVLERNGYEHPRSRPTSQQGSRPGTRGESSRPSTSASGSESRRRRTGSADGNVTERSSSDASAQVMNTSKLERLLHDDGVDGTVMRRIMESTVRYKPDRDAIVLKAFQSKHITYPLFRHYLNSAFWLSFSDLEYANLTSIFDPAGQGVIDGYSFMIAFIRLGGIRKDHHAAAVREQNESFILRQAAAEQQRQRELESKNQVAADFDFDAAIRKLALEKLVSAAKGYDPGSPSGATLEAFKASHLSVSVLRDTIRSAFNLRVNAKEIAAILVYFDERDKGKGSLMRQVVGADGHSTAAATETKCAQLEVNCKDFLRHFFRIGIVERDRDKAEQRQKQARLDKIAEEEEKRKLSEAESKLSMQVDYEYSAADCASAMEKLKETSTKYDKNASGCQALDGFECESLSPGAFKDLIRRIFNLVLSNKELGYVVSKYDTAGTGRVMCKQFLIEFLRLGIQERHDHHMRQLEKQKKVIEDGERVHVEKMNQVIEGTAIDISYDYVDTDVANILAKLTEASVFFDKECSPLISFEPSHLSAIDFIRSVKRTFNVRMTPAELGYLMKTYDIDGSQQLHCKTFLQAFMALGHEQRDKIRLGNWKRNIDGEKLMQEKAEKKRSEMLNKGADTEVDYGFTDEDRDSALAKLLVASTKYDRAHPAAMGLEGFDCFSMSAVAFKDIVRRTFNLKLRPKEVGALIRHFGKSEAATEIECGDFLSVFLQMGYAERARLHSEKLERQRSEDRARVEESEAKLLKITQRAGAGLVVDMAYSDADMYSVIEKLVGASEKYDKNHPAAPDLSAFDMAYLVPGIFKENMKRCFGIKLEPKELGFCIATYGNADQTINSQDFMTKFLKMGKQSRYEKHRKFLVKQRELIREAKVEAETKVVAQLERKEKLQVPSSDFSAADLSSALEKMRTAAFLYNDVIPAKVFNGSGMKAGEFREVVKNSLNLRLGPREVAALANHFAAGAAFTKDSLGATDGTTLTTSTDVSSQVPQLDTKAFKNEFIRMSFQSKSDFKARELERQRAAERELAAEAERKLHDAGIGKTSTSVDFAYSEVDRESVYRKMTETSTKYDKNAPGCVSPESFDAAFLSPHDFRGVMKRVFGMSVTDKELGVLLDEFKDSDGNLACKPFMIAFTKLGADERRKFEVKMIENQRSANLERKTHHERLMKEMERKHAVSISYDYTAQDSHDAFESLAQCAKKYDKNAPGCMSLESFEQKVLSTVQFKEALQRTFGLTLPPAQLGAVVNHFDKTGDGSVVSKDFVIHFLRVGQELRSSDYSAVLSQQRMDDEDRKKTEEEALVAAWKKAEGKIVLHYTEQEKAVAMEKLADAAFKFDPASPGPMGLTAFQASHLSPAVFREMLRRSFNLKVTDAELAAIIDEFQGDSPPSGKKMVDCAVFMVSFTQVGFQRRGAVRAAQLEKNKLGLAARKAAHIGKMAELADKMAEVADYNFTQADFKAALEKLRQIAANYDRGHPSAPSLAGFQGANMPPHEFRDMVMRCFHVPLTGKELGSLVKYFDASQTLTIDSQEFLAHFFKICRQEQEKRRKLHIHKERSLRRAARQEELALLEIQQKEEMQRLCFSPTDEITFLAKLRAAAKSYAIDSAAMQVPLQAFKGPALNPMAFRDTFARVFIGSKFTFPEVGVLLSILDLGKKGVVDGPQFLKWLYKLGRQEGRIMLGEIADCVTLADLRSAAQSGGPQATDEVLSRETSPMKSRQGSIRPRTRSADNQQRTRSDPSKKESQSETIAAIVEGIKNGGKTVRPSTGSDNRGRSVQRAQSSMQFSTSNTNTGSHSSQPAHVLRSRSNTALHPTTDNRTTATAVTISTEEEMAFAHAVAVFSAPPSPPRLGTLLSPSTLGAGRPASRSSRRSATENSNALAPVQKLVSGSQLHVVVKPEKKPRPSVSTPELAISSKSRACNNLSIYTPSLPGQADAVLDRRHDSGFDPMLPEIASPIIWPASTYEDGFKNPPASANPASASMIGQEPAVAAELYSPVKILPPLSPTAGNGIPASSLLMKSIGVSLDETECDGRNNATNEAQMRGNRQREKLVLVPAKARAKSMSSGFFFPGLATAHQAAEV